MKKNNNEPTSDRNDLGRLVLYKVFFDAPTLQWCMLAKGDIDGIVIYNSEGDDLYSGILMVKEAGGIVVDYEGHPFTGMKEEPYIIACHPDHKDGLLKVVREGMALFAKQM